MFGRLGLVLLAVVSFAGTAFAGGSKAGDPQKRHNPADQVWAQAIRPQRADLGPGDWRVESGNDDDSRAPKACRDPNLSDLVETGSSEDPDWSRNGSFIGSSAVVFMNERQSTTAWNRLARKDINECLLVAFKSGLAGSGARLRIASSGPIAMPKLAPHFKAGRIRLVVSGPGATIKGRMSYYLAARGRATVLLMVASFDRPMQPISEALERRVANLVAKRLER
jgi:hypothetical protein